MALVISDPTNIESRDASTVSVPVADLELVLAVYSETGGASRYVESADGAWDRLRECIEASS